LITLKPFIVTQTAIDVIWGRSEFIGNWPFGESEFYYLLSKKDFYIIARRTVSIALWPVVGLLGKFLTIIIRAGYV